MIASIKQAMQGMIVQMQKQDQIANNLANVNTNGFKGSSLFATSIEKYYNNPVGEILPERIIRADQVFVDFSEGTTRETGNQLDCMIKGSGFFTAMTNDGLRYTRDGAFQLDGDGFLVTSEGDRIFGEDGFIRVDNTKGIVTIFDNGTVSQDGQEIGTLRIADFNKPYRLARMGNNYFKPLLPDNPVLRSEGCVIKQGYLESSNVEVISAMTQMISAQRSYEVISKALSSEDATLDKAVNIVGKL